jgi:hypothetical protein
MIYRCSSPSSPIYKDYGGRGIDVSPEWRASFDQFVDDMGPRPAGYTLERKDNDGPYSKDNCRWASRAEQAQNRRKPGKRSKPTRMTITYNGKTQSPKAWAKELGMNVNTLWGRLNAHGWSVERALSTPTRPRKAFVSGELILTTRPPKTSKYVGVHFNAKKQKFVAQVYTGNKKRKKLGPFKTEEQAAIARDLYVAGHGLKLQMNFPTLAGFMKSLELEFGQQEAA